MTGGPDLAALTGRLSDLAGLIDTTGDPDGLGIGLLREHGLMSYTVPAEYGGAGAGTAAFMKVAGELGGQCLGLAVLWVMHCQQVAVIDGYAAEPLRSRVLRAVAAEQALLGSITTEAAKGGHMMTATAALDDRDGMLRFHRDAPVVSGGARADAFLVTMRRSEDSAPDDVVLVYCPRALASPKVVAPLAMLGMRGTCNVSMSIDAEVPADHLIEPPGGFARLASRTMAPLGHLGWAAAWTGAAREAVRHVVGHLRRPAAGGPRLRRDDDVLDRVAVARRHLDVAEAMAVAGLREYELHDGAERDRPSFQIMINNVKVAVSEHAFAAVDELMEVAGLGLGYQAGGGLVLERVFRDLRSASLMYGNRRLLRANGKLGLLDAAACSFPAAGPLGRG
ncbi:acyl-CoA dehydrogenase family protein [Actinomadura rugatobispora]|uniref:Acyl-CoA dehydrogenase family protein n=1 Tax=Actinomadura rugatobispora TaxID=1994 RepID=A0ABW0ZME7_9ACTN|nr:acyl-CoA dehydrogenase family protein [Actinomadura rugatobispora]